VPAFFVATEDRKGGAEPDEVTIQVPGMPDEGTAQCASWAGDGSHRIPMMQRANQTPAFDAVRIRVRKAEEQPPAEQPPAEEPPAVEPPAEEPPAEEPTEAGYLTEEEAMVRYLSEDERQQTEKVSALQRLYRLNTAEKVITALKGSREERAILVRDPNRIVSTAVLGSPRLTEAEVEAFAGMKSVSNRDWTKKYGVMSNLVRNPRTPLAISLGMVPRLNPRDLKSISVDRNVPEVIRKHATRFVRNQGGGPGDKR
jgi:hypothetical protein